VPHLRHFGFQRSDPVTLVVLTAPRGLARLLEIVNETLEATARPHVVSPVDGGVAALLLTRDVHMIVDLLDRAVREAGVGRVVIGVSTSFPQTAVATARVPAERAAAAARLDGRGIGWFDELRLATLVSDEEIRSRLWALTRPAVDALSGDGGSREADLLPSLEAFLHHNGSWEAAARALGVHRHTLRARMARVEELTGLSLDVAENRALFLLALISRPRGG